MVAVPKTVNTKADHKTSPAARNHKVAYEDTAFGTATCHHGAQVARLPPDLFRIASRLRIGPPADPRILLAGRPHRRSSEKAFKKAPRLRMG